MSDPLRSHGLHSPLNYPGQNTIVVKVHIVKAMVFPVVIYGCESWTIKKAECQRIDAFNCGAGKDSQESLGLQDQTIQS